MAKAGRSLSSHSSESSRSRRKRDKKKKERRKSRDRRSREKGAKKERKGRYSRSRSQERAKEKRKSGERAREKQKEEVKEMKNEIVEEKMMKKGVSEMFETTLVEKLAPNLNFKENKPTDQFKAPGLAIDKKVKNIAFEIYDSDNKADSIEPRGEAENNSLSTPTPLNITVNEGLFRSESMTEKAESELKMPKPPTAGAQPESESSGEEEYEEDVPEGMMEILGFTQFNTSKGKDHSKTAVEGVFKNKSHAIQPRQYMGRRGGFNKPLDKV